jgi:phosphohistidine phosphatase
VWDADRTMASDGTVTLHFLRHAHAGDPLDWPGPDEARPLTRRGRRQSEHLGAFLAERGIRPDAILTSPKVRAAQTAEIVAETLGRDVIVDERLASLLDLATLDAILADARARAPMVVGHDPDFTELLCELCGAAGLEMKKAALATVAVRRPLAAGEGILRWLVPPDLLGDEH